MRCRILSLIIILYNTVPACLGESVRVRCDPESVCALRETAVTLSCSYSNLNIMTSFWFSPKQKAKWRDENQPEDLASDSAYAGRVNYTQSTDSSSALMIRDLRESDSGGYQLILITAAGEKHISSPVNLTVADLQLSVRENALHCNTSCMLPSANQKYHWYKDGQYDKQYDNRSSIPQSSDEEGSYSCSVRGYNDVFSPTVCVSKEGCWNVSYTERRVCVLEGSSVNLSCSYSLPNNYRVKKTYWHLATEDQVELRSKGQFIKRVDFNSEHKSSHLKIRDVKTSDTGEYRFRIRTDSEPFSGKPGVILHVTGLHVRVSPSTVSDGQTVTLSCMTDCTLNGTLTYVWYKDGHPVTNKPTPHNQLLLQCSEDTGDYSCAVRGRETLRSPPLTIRHKCSEEKPVVLYSVVAGVAVFLTLIVIIGALWMWRAKHTPGPGQRSAEESAQSEVHYSSVRFAPFHAQKKSRPHGSREKERTHYAVLNFS